MKRSLLRDSLPDPPGGVPQLCSPFPRRNSKPHQNPPLQQVEGLGGHLNRETLEKLSMLFGVCAHPLRKALREKYGRFTDEDTQSCASEGLAAPAQVQGLRPRRPDRATPQDAWGGGPADRGLGTVPGRRSPKHGATRAPGSGRGEGTRGGGAPGVRDKR